MQFENSFTIDAPVGEVWVLLTDLPAIVPCLPGATLTDENEGVCTGAVRIKVGPVTAEYRGSAELTERDESTHRVVIDANGSDVRNAGKARMLLTAQLTETGDSTRVDLSTDLVVIGKVTRFGRGVMQEVSQRLLHQFAGCVAITLEGTSALEAVASAGAQMSSSSEPATGDEAFDLLEVAGTAVFKRALPVAVVSLAVLVLLFIMI